MTGKEGEPYFSLPLLLEDFPLGQPQRWRGSHRGREYVGEVILTDKWSPAFGQRLGKRTSFRIVIFTQPQELPPGALKDPRIVVCVPSRPTPKVTRLTQEYRSIAEERARYETRPMAQPEETLHSLSLRERETKERLVEEERNIYATGVIYTQQERHLDIRGVFTSLALDDILQNLMTFIFNNASLPYAQLVAKEFKPITDIKEILEQESLLLERLHELQEQLKDAEENLRFLSDSLERPPGMETQEALRKLSNICQAKDLLDFYAIAQRQWADPADLARALSMYQGLQQLRVLAPEIVATKAYLERAEPGQKDDELALDRISVLEQLNIASLSLNPQLWESIHSLFNWFKSRYSAAYVAHHSSYHGIASDLSMRLHNAALKVEALRRFNSIIELGKPVADALATRYNELLVVSKPCPVEELGEEVIGTEPLCPSCELRLTSHPPMKEVETFLNHLESALLAQCRRLSSETVRRILAKQGDKRLNKFLKIVQASDISSLVNTLDDDLVSFLRRFLKEGSR